MAVRKRLKISNVGLAKLCKVHPRSFSDWAHRKIMMPDHAFAKLTRLGKYHPVAKTFPDKWHIKNASRKGGLVRTQLHGNPGTKDGRILGGYNSYKSFLKAHKKGKKTNFVLQKNINLPKRSAKLAELFGSILGDGGISKYQLTITLHKKDDKKYSQHVGSLIRGLFKTEPTYYERDSVMQVTVSSRKLIIFLTRNGLLIGGKVRQQVGVPDWISAKPLWIKFCLKGLMDTDGCFYIDRHHVNKKTYLNPALVFTNRSLPVLNFFKKKIEKFGLHPTQKTKYSVFLRRKGEIIRYFKKIGSSNPKHLKKFSSYLKNI